tara:strand:- start:388 stop:897 length:510 start_codon:yes stop_codon:yes gene_type:complete
LARVVTSSVEYVHGRVLILAPEGLADLIRNDSSNFITKNVIALAPDDIAGLEFDEASLNNEFDQFELEFIAATKEYDFSAQYVSHSLIETFLRVGVGLGGILVILIGSWVIRVASRSTWLVGFVAVCFLPISLFMISCWVFPVLGVIVLLASLNWLLKLRFSRSTLKAA